MNSNRPLRPAPDPREGCHKHAWCEDATEGHTEHRSPNDWVPATADSTSFSYEVTAGGVLIPSITPQLIEEDDDHDYLRGVFVEIEVIKAGRDTSIVLTLDEATLLRNRLTRLIQAATQES